MSDYKRFISYVYEYREDKKQENRGFVKVEARNGQCQMDFVLKGLCRDGSGTCQLYAFRRIGTLLEGSLLDTRNVQDGMMSCRLQMPCSEIGDGTYSLEETAGLLILCDQERIYATQWDDDPLNFQGFPNTIHDKTTDATVSTVNTEPADSTPPDSQAEDSTVNSLPDARSDEIINNTQPDNPATNEVTDDTNPDSPPNESPEDALPESAPPTDEAETDNSAEADVQATSAPASSPNYFRDGSIINCVKITPQDLNRLDARDWHLKNNQFVHYGYQAFGHLLVGQLADSGQTVLCVPGSYHQRECFMANMFCFPHFKQCPGRTDSRRCFGYWYRSIHPTNLNSGNCDS